MLLGSVHTKRLLMRNFSLMFRNPTFYYGHSKQKSRILKAHSHGATATATTFSHVNTLIDIHATHSQMKLLSLSLHVNTPKESNVTYYLSQSLWIERPSVSVEHWQLLSDITFAIAIPTCERAFRRVDDVGEKAAKRRRQKLVTIRLADGRTDLCRVWHVVEVGSTLPVMIITCGGFRISLEECQPHGGGGGA